MQIFYVYLKQDEFTDIGVMTSKEGNLEVEEGISDRKRPLVKPTKYHYYPHNQHLYLLPECATQQVSIYFPCAASLTSLNNPFFFLGGGGVLYIFITTSDRLTSEATKESQFMFSPSRAVYQIGHTADVALKLTKQK